MQKFESGYKKGRGCHCIKGTKWGSSLGKQGIKRFALVSPTQMGVIKVPFPKVMLQLRRPSMWSSKENNTHETTWLLPLILNKVLFLKGFFWLLIILRNAV